MTLWELPEPSRQGGMRGFVVFRLHFIRTRVEAPSFNYCLQPELQGNPKMRKTNKTLRALGYAAPAILTFALSVPAIGYESTDENLWSAKKEGNAWTTRYGECWKSKTGPRSLDPCAMVAEVTPPEEITVHLNFEFNEFKVPDNIVNKGEIVKIDDYIAQLKATPEKERVTAVGHTDAKGSDKYNMKLGMRRAEAVRKYITDRGYPHVAPAESRGEMDAKYPETAPAIQRLEDRYVTLSKTTQP